MTLEIQTDRWIFTVEGQAKPSVWSDRVAIHAPLLQVALDGDDQLQCATVDGSPRAVSGLSLICNGPQLSEQTSYRLTVVSRLGLTPSLSHLDPSLISNVRAIPGRPEVLSGSINFESQVGRSLFRVDDGDASAEVTVEVRPTKLDYDDDYQDLLDGVAGLTRQLVLEFLRATTRSAGQSEVADPRDIEWLLLLREELLSLTVALEQIARHPYRQLVREPNTVPAERIKRPSPVTRRAVARGSGEGQWAIAPFGRHRMRLPAMLPLETLDSPENRWLRVQLDRVTRSLAQLRGQFVAGAMSRSGRLSARSQAIADELEAMEQAIAPYLSRPPFVEALGPVAPGFSSLTLQGQPGYREAYQSLLRLRMSVLLDGDALETPVKDLHDLYEIWCFLAVVREVSRVLDVTVDIHDLVEIRDSGVTLNVVPGQHSSVRVGGSDFGVRVSYNREFRMVSGRQRPDIVIEVFRKDLAPVILILDAKYRVQTAPDYVSTYSCPGPPVEAIGQLHRYRDAITVKYAGYRRGRPVVRAVALFPMSATDSIDWILHPFLESIDDVGIGALPFLPSNMDWVREWLQHGLTAPPALLAWPGSEFIAWADLRGR